MFIRNDNRHPDIFVHFFFVTVKSFINKIYNFEQKHFCTHLTVKRFSLSLSLAHSDNTRSCMQHIHTEIYVKNKSQMLELMHFRNYTTSQSMGINILVFFFGFSHVYMQRVSF